MDYHLLFSTATPSPTVAKTFEAIMTNVIHEYELALFWWALRLAFYYILARELVYTFIPWCLWSLKAYIESFFPLPLIGMARAAADAAVDAAEDAAEDLLEGAGDVIEGVADQVGAICGNPALAEEAKEKEESDKK